MQSKTPTSLMAKAIQAVASARVLLALGDEDGACNRAYYAMFDSAQAALLISGVPAPDALGKSHRGLINTFSAYLVKDGPMSKELGRQLKRAEEMRLVADYNGESVRQAAVIEGTRGQQVAGIKPGSWDRVNVLENGPCAFR